MMVIRAILAFREYEPLSILDDYELVLTARPRQPKPRAPRGTFDRVAYQREWMRRHRAKRSAP